MVRLKHKTFSDSETETKPKIKDKIKSPISDLNSQCSTLQPMDYACPLLITISYQIRMSASLWIKANKWNTLPSQPLLKHESSLSKGTFAEECCG